jgi:hypothetical protein
MFGAGLNRGAYYGIGYGMQGLDGIVNWVMDGGNGKYQKEADQLGVQYAWKGGFDPRGSLEFWTRSNGDAGSALLPRSQPFRNAYLSLFSEITYLPPLTNAISDSPTSRR